MMYEPRAELPPAPPTRRSRRRRPGGLIGLLLLVAIALGLTACESAPAPTTPQQSQQAITNQYMEAATNAVPYPLTSMISGGWLERTLLKENLLRQNNAHRRAFVTLMNVMGQPIIQFPIQGMVFDMNSQMTTTDIINNYNSGTSYGYGVTTAAAGDNGTWGPEPSGVSFFTVSGMQVKWNGWYVETDAPLTMPSKPLLTYDVKDKPSTTGGIVGNGTIDVGGAAARKP